MINYKRIVLIGFRGSGKSMLGNLLAQHLNWKCISTDLLVEQQNQKKIAEIVKESGWKRFREAEQLVIQSVSKRTNVVIDCGGGVIEEEYNMQLLGTGSFIIWIDAKLEDIIKRISNDTAERPLLSQQNMHSDIIKNYYRWRPLYQKYANVKVDSSKKTPEMLCQFILKRLNFSK